MRDPFTDNAEMDRLMDLYAAEERAAVKRAERVERIASRITDSALPAERKLQMIQRLKSLRLEAAADKAMDEIELQIPAA